MAEAGRDEQLKGAAANRGLKLVKSRRRIPGAGDYGRFGLADPSGKELFGFGPDGLTATADEIEAFLYEGQVSDWKGSLKQAGPTPRAQRRRAIPARPAQAPEPESEPQPLVVRDARTADADAVAALVTELGFAATGGELVPRLTALKRAGEAALVAERDEVVGVLTWHVTPVLHRPHPVGRITMMVVAESERRRGVGRALVEAAIERCSARGCGLIEVTSNIDLSPAHTFYRQLGFERTSYRFARRLDSAKE